jgi:hypothetical protein
MWSPRPIALALARLAFVAALFVAMEIVALVMERVAMVLTVVTATLVLAWTAVRVPARLLPRCARMVGVVAVLALAPVDLWLSQTGNMGLELAYPAWGYPTPAMRDRARRGEIELRGCMRPPNPPLLVLRVTF